MKTMAMDESAATTREKRWREGEPITANVSVSFILE
jgi:hypothetical protein